MAAAAAGPSVYEREFGVVPIVNCIGTFTSLGGSRMHPDAVRGVSEAAGHFVDMNKLYEAAGEKVARMTAQPDTHSAHITNGAAAAIALLSAALLTGEDPARVTQLPSLEGIARHEIVIDGHDEHDGHTRWMMAAKLTGARVVQVGRVGAPMTAAGLRAALGTGRVMLVLVFENGEPTRIENGQMPWEEIMEVAHSSGAAVAVDAAARIPPASNLSYYSKAGADAVIFSGGKHMRGPQTSGLLVARREIIAAARLNGSPNEEAICRPMKVSKEGVVAFVAALRAFLAEEDGSAGGQMDGFEASVERMRLAFAAVEGVVGARRVCPGDASIQPNDIPRLYVDVLEPEAQGSTTSRGEMDHGNPLDVQPRDPPSRLAHALVNGTPRIAVIPSRTGIILNPQTMSHEDEALVVRRVAEILGEQMQQPVEAPSAATARL